MKVKLFRVHCVVTTGAMYSGITACVVLVTLVFYNVCEGKLSTSTMLVFSNKTIADIYDTALKKHEDLDRNRGVLIAVEKTGKRKGPPGNLRPITLLNSPRKALSIVTLNWIRAKVEEYLSKNQSGFRPDRRTADVIWQHR